MYDGNSTALLDEESLDDAFLYPEAEEDLWPAYLTWIQKVFCTLSIVSSYAICRELVADLRADASHRRGSHSMQTRRVLQPSIGRILLNLSLADIVFSVAVFLGEWPAPKDTRYIHNAAGNRAACTFQGWMRALGYLSSPLFSVALNAFYLLLIRYRWQDADLAKLERMVVLGIWLYALVLSIVPIPLQAYNSDYDVCWIVPSPLDCLGDECERGLIANDLEIYYSFVHIWSCMFVCAGLMMWLFGTVRGLEDKSLAHHRRITNGMVSMETRHAAAAAAAAPNGSNEISRKSQNNEDPTTEDPEPDETTDPPAEAVTAAAPNCRKSRLSNLVKRARNRASSWFRPSATGAHQKSRAVAYQGILYTLAFLSTHLLDMIASIIWRLHEAWNLYFDIAAYMVLQPSLGVLNWLIFCRNRTHMATPEGRVWRRLFFCCGLCKTCGTHETESAEGGDATSRTNHSNGGRPGTPHTSGIDASATFHRMEATDRTPVIRNASAPEEIEC